MKEAGSQQQVRSAWGGKAAGGGFLGLSFISLIYGALLLYFLYQLVSAWQKKKKLEGPLTKYPRKLSMPNLLICLLIAVLGVVSMVGGQYLDGLIMILLSASFLAFMSAPVYLATNGLLSNNLFFSWAEIRKWAWDTKRGDLIILTKERGKNEKSNAIHIGIDRMEEINQKIRELKLGKK